MEDICREGLRRLSMHMDEAAIGTHPGEKKGSWKGRAHMIPEERMRKWAYLYSFGKEGIWGQTGINRNLQGIEEGELAKEQSMRNEMPRTGAVEKQTSSFPEPLTNGLANSPPQGGQFHLKANHLGSCIVLLLGMRQQVNEDTIASPSSPRLVESGCQSQERGRQCLVRVLLMDACSLA